MTFRLATFNVENLMNRFDFSGFRDRSNIDRTLALFQIKDEAEYRALEAARTISHTDDTRQLTALAVAATHADILCLQEVDNIEALRAFEYGYLFKMIGEGYKLKFTTTGNDMRGIDVAVILREQTHEGLPIAFVNLTTHAALTFEEAGLYSHAVAAAGFQPHERIFRRDCLEIDLTIGGAPFTLYGVHLKSMGSPREGVAGRDVTMALRVAEASAIRGIVEARFGRHDAASKNWAICGDFNDYRQRIMVSGDDRTGYEFSVVDETVSGLDILLADGFAVNAVERRPALERWTLYHTRGPRERHLCQLDYILLSPALAKRNPTAVPDIIRNGQPYRTIFPPGQETPRFPRVGWDRPKASDHCPVAISLNLG